MRRYILAITLSAVLGLTAMSAQAAPAPTWSLTAVGDIMLDRYVWTLIQRNGADYPFKNITSTLRGADVVLGNLEGPFTSSPKHALAGGTLSFNFSPTLAPVLKRSGFTALSLANNHTLNQGQRGLDSTRETLRRAGLDFFADPRNKTNHHFTKTINGQRVTFLGYDNLDGKIDTLLTDIANADRKGEYVIIMAHWGAEYRLDIQPRVQQQAKQLIDAGADIILGAHPHVVEPLEIYKGKLIAYSLGNFIFDQYFSADTELGLMIKLVFSPTSISVNLVPLVSRRSQVAVASDTIKTKMLQRLAARSIVSDSLRPGIQSGLFTIPL